MAARPPPPPDIARIAGPLLVGYLLHWGLFGVLSMQVYVYCLAFPNGHHGKKALVFGIYGIETVQTFVLACSAFKAFASGFGDMTALTDGSILWVSIPIFGSIVAFVVQVFYAYRITLLAKSNILTGLILLLAGVQLGGGIATGVIADRANTDFVRSRTHVETLIWNGAGAICDVLISSAMIHSLFQPGGKRKPTQRIFRRFIRFIIETGTLTAAIAILNLTLSILPGKYFYFQTSSVVLGKIYSTTMMVVVNSRIKLLRTAFDQSQSETLKTSITFLRTVVVTHDDDDDDDDEYTLSSDSMPGSPIEKEENNILPSESRQR
ncbi:hypothetical protein GALMADRAFT_247492 [Galerina marginata CBS 339.88]|uniref:DUF6534 domain-containing protein n=1 Tax=Galerina marginata (strain CBS 339.88) TaxID=685588 RepID=A0A067SZA4_GALM3|nr:hypothetical protein GALMADRAFT_247492 [Galerina marginata CBS 339.88]